MTGHLTYWHVDLMTDFIWWWVDFILMMSWIDDLLIYTGSVKQKVARFFLLTVRSIYQIKVADGNMYTFSLLYQNEKVYIFPSAPFIVKAVILTDRISDLWVSSFKMCYRQIDGIDLSVLIMSFVTDRWKLCCNLFWFKVVSLTDRKKYQYIDDYLLFFCLCSQIYILLTLLSNLRNFWVSAINAF